MPAAVMLTVTRRYTACLALIVLLAAGCQSTTGASPATAPDKIAPAVTAALSRLQAGQALDPHQARSDAAGRLQVYVYVTEFSAASMQALATSGLVGALPSPSLSLVQGWIAPQDVGALAALSVVTRITLPRYAIHY